MKREIKIALFTGLAMILLIGLLPAGSLAGNGRVMYNKFNIHAQADRNGLLKASYANYTDPGAGHVIIPANTKLVIKPWKRFFKNYGFYFTLPDGRKGVYEVHTKRLGMSVEEYEKLILADHPVTYKGLSAIDKKGIKNGRAYKGMSKKGVMIALGYPSPHATPSPQENQWKYWRNRFATTVVEFNGKGIVTNVR